MLTQNKATFFETTLPKDEKSTQPLWLAPLRHDASEIEAAIRKMWPTGKDSITADEFAAIVFDIPTNFPDFVNQFGSNYQTGITKEHLKKLFWLAIPRMPGPNHEAIMPEKEIIKEDTFTRAVAALYRPNYGPLAREAQIPAPAWTTMYRYFVSADKATTMFRDPESAASAISTIYDGLHGTIYQKFYFGAIEKYHFIRLLQAMSTDVKRYSSGTATSLNPGYVLWFAQSQHDSLTPWGINITCSFLYPIPTPRESFMQDFPLVVRCGSNSYFFIGAPCKPSKTLADIHRHFVSNLCPRYPRLKEIKETDEKEAKAWEAGLRTTNLTPDTINTVLSYAECSERLSFYRLKDIKAVDEIEAKAWEEGLLTVSNLTPDTINTVLSYAEFGERLAYYRRR